MGLRGTQVTRNRRSTAACRSRMGSFLVEERSPRRVGWSDEGGNLVVLGAADFVRDIPRTGAVRNAVTTPTTGDADAEIALPFLHQVAD